MRVTRLFLAGNAALVVALLPSTDLAADGQALEHVLAACSDKSNPQSSADACKAINIAEGTTDAAFSAAYSDIGAGYIEQKDYARTIANCTESIRLNPRNRYAFFNRGVAYSNQKEFARATADFSEALRLNPKDIDALNNRGYTYMQQHDFAHAIADYDEVIRIDPRNETAISSRQIAYDLLKAGHGRPVGGATR